MDLASRDMISKVTLMISNATPTQDAHSFNVSRLGVMQHNLVSSSGIRA